MWHFYFRKAFDCVNTNVLLRILEDVGFPSRLLELYSKVRLTLGGEWFEQDRRVLQGAPYLLPCST